MLNCIPEITSGSDVLRSVVELFYQPAGSATSAWMVAGLAGFSTVTKTLPGAGSRTFQELVQDYFWGHLWLDGISTAPDRRQEQTRGRAS